MKKIILTGGTGFIGSHLVKRILSCNDYSAVVISNRPAANYKFSANNKSPKDKQLSYHTADIRDKNTISKIFKVEKPDVCIHLAAKISVADSIKNPDETIDINVNGTLNLLDACYKTQVNNFIFASSAAVYGDVRKLPISEDYTLNPLSPYGASKMFAEQYVTSYGKLKKIQNTLSLRIFNVYGIGQTSDTDVISTFISRLTKGLSPIIHGDGTNTRDFISVDDVTKAFLLSIRSIDELNNEINDKFKSSVFNIGTGIPTSITDLAEKMIKIFGLDLHPAYETRRNEGIILHSYADVSRAKEILNFVPNKRIDDGLKEMILPLMLRK